MTLPDIRLLQAAIALSEALNFSRAAERLHVVQPTLSKQILELESQLGFRLFIRTRRYRHIAAA
jgi:DNA-binding transcriptional LysR family regulator